MSQTGSYYNGAERNSLAWWTCSAVDGVGFCGVTPKLCCPVVVSCSRATAATDANAAARAKPSRRGRVISLSTVHVFPPQRLPQQWTPQYTAAVCGASLWRFGGRLGRTAARREIGEVCQMGVNFSRPNKQRHLGRAEREIEKANLPPPLSLSLCLSVCLLSYYFFFFLARSIFTCTSTLQNFLDSTLSVPSRYLL